MSTIQRRVLAITLAIVGTTVAGWVFYRSVKEGAPNWNLLILACGMAFLLYVIAISGARRKKS